jgi:hypothetical protein
MSVDIKSWVRSGINAYRLHSRQSVAEVAAKLGVSRITVYHWLSYKYPNKIPSQDKRNKLVTTLGLKPFTGKIKTSAAAPSFKKIGHLYQVNNLLKKYDEYAGLGPETAWKFTQRVAYVCSETISQDFQADIGLNILYRYKNIQKNICELTIAPFNLPITFSLLLAPGKAAIEYELYWKFNSANDPERTRYGTFCVPVLVKLLKWINQLLKQNNKSRLVFDYDLFRTKIQEIQWL